MYEEAGINPYRNSVDCRTLQLALQAALKTNGGASRSVSGAASPSAAEGADPRAAASQMRSALETLSSRFDVPAVTWAVKVEQGQLSAQPVGTPGHIIYDKDGQARVSLSGRRPAAPVQLPGGAGASEEEATIRMDYEWVHRAALDTAVYAEDRDCEASRAPHSKGQGRTRGFSSRCLQDHEGLGQIAPIYPSAADD